MSENRDWNSPEYKKLRLDTKRRDKFRCRFPGCKSKKKLKVHHIKRWSDFPQLRFSLSNTITLCGVHHNMIYGKEDEYSAIFMSVLAGKDLAMEMILMKYQ